MFIQLYRYRFLLIGAAFALPFGGATLRAEKPATKDEPKAATPEENARALQKGMEMLLDPIQRIREAAARAQASNNLKPLGIALHRYQDQPVFPAQPQFWYQPQPPIQSWILPYLEQGNIYNQVPYQTFFCPSDSRSDGRFGTHIEPVSAVLASQGFALPKDAGQVIGEVEKGKAADKAGLRQHDILLKLNGKDVPRDAGAFGKLLAEIKADKAVDAEVLREGKRTAIKALTLPEAAIAPPYGMNYLFADGSVRFRTPNPDLLMSITDGTSSTILIGERFAPFPNPEGWKVWSKGDPILSTTFRNKERYTTRHQEGTLVLTVVGTVKDGKAAIGSITVREGSEEKKYKVLDKVPAEYRDKVEQMVEFSGK